MISFKQISKEPLIHFLLIGIAIFILHAVFNSEKDTGKDSIILIDDNDINRLIVQYKQVWNETPDESTIQKLIQQYVESEMTYREALSMNLDHNDEIIKRRLKQKYEFLVKDLITSSDPSDVELKAYYEDHIEDFHSAKLYSFTQYYFSPDKRQAALEDAKQFLEDQIKNNPDKLNATHVAADPIHLKSSYRDATSHLIRQDFGIEFLEQIETQGANNWVGPFSSGFGIHILFIDSIGQSRPISFEDAKDKVRISYEEDLTKTYNRNLLNKIKDNYEIKYDLDKWKNLVK